MVIWREAAIGKPGLAEGDTPNARIIEWAVSQIRGGWAGYFVAKVYGVEALCMIAKETVTVNVGEHTIEAEIIGRSIGPCGIQIVWRAIDGEDGDAE